MVDQREVETDRIDHSCEQERRIRNLESEVKEHGARLHAGDMTLQAINIKLENVVKSVDKLTEAIEKLNAGSPLLDKVKESAITWSVPAIIIAIVWAIVKSGQIPGLTH